jgi:hypothetical protein
MISNDFYLFSTAFLPAGLLPLSFFVRHAFRHRMLIYLGWRQQMSRQRDA